ncbi:MAG: asparagine synthase (glutamine-hydrolyzing) [Candidatus Aminicenantales bacterium]
MCGFIGVINKNGAPVDVALLSRMAETIRHRGPDEEGHYVDGPVGFYHKRLSVIDPAGGCQPMTRGSLTAVFNGEIYNYGELREFLKKKGHSFTTNSDTEVLLGMYQEFGPECVRHLNGMFAFLIHDRKKKRLLAARDHFGIKPLYFWENKNHLLFASEIKALLEHPAVAVEPSYEAVQEYMIFQYVLNSETFFKNIRKIRPGHYQAIDLESFAARDVSYWEPDFTVDTHHTEEYFVDSLRALLDDSIRLQLRSDVPLGTTLSGGMDSSIVTILASQNTPRPLQTFTGAFREGADFDETPYAREVAELCGAEMNTVVLSERDFIDALPKLVYHMDEPMAGPGLFPQYMVARLAAQKVKVILGGQGGDEIFGGYTRYVIAYLEQALKGAIFETNDEGEHIVTLKSILPNLPFVRRYIPTLRYFWKSDLFEPMDQRYFRLIDRSRGDRSDFSNDFNSSFNLDRIFSRFQQVFNHPQTLSYYNKMVHFDMVASLPALLHVEDRVTMACSLESRVPLLDRRIVELVTSMPPGMKFKGAEMKYILKRAMKDIVPPLIYGRKDKMGFPVPLHIWARNHLRTFCQDILLSPTCKSRGLFNSRAVEQLISQEEAYSRKLWGLLNVELWFRQFIDRGGQRSKGERL